MKQQTNRIQKSKKIKYTLPNLKSAGIWLQKFLHTLTSSSTPKPQPTQTPTSAYHRTHTHTHTASVIQTLYVVHVHVCVGTHTRIRTHAERALLCSRLLVSCFDQLFATRSAARSKSPQNWQQLRIKEKEKQK